MRTILLAVATVTGLGAAGSAAAQAAMPARPCVARYASTVEAGDVAANPAAFAGKCVKLTGWWRDIAVYPTRSEAAVVDALSIPLLDNRRIGLYLPSRDLAAAPQSPRLSTIVGVVGACAQRPAADGSADKGYCDFKAGTYLTVTSVASAR